MLGKSESAEFKGDARFAPEFALKELAEHAVDFWLTSEDLPDPNNRVTVRTDGQISLSYTENNLEGHRRLLAKLKELLAHSGCETRLIPNALYLGKKIPIAGVAHENGTIRFGNDPQTSALDVHCKAHEIDNLYVVDGSFFCSSTAVNPALTIMANALRVGDHLRERFGITQAEHVSALSSAARRAATLAAAESREWLVTNGLGGFACGTIAGTLTRRYHGLLAALKPPVGRTLMVAAFDEVASYLGGTYELAANRWHDGTIAPRRYACIERFRLDGSVPVWEYAVSDALIEKRLWMDHGSNATVVRYTRYSAKAALSCGCACSQTTVTSTRPRGRVTGA